MVHILIVVDDAVSLARSRQALRGHRRSWSLTYAESAPAAVEMLSADAYDAVLADLSQPDEDGPALLRRVKDAHPAALRLLACGRDDLEKLARSMGPAHQYLPRPYDPEQFRSLIERALSLSERLTRPGLRRLASAVESLPSLPTVYLELLDELSSPDASIHQVAALISQDLGMSAKVLQLINSPFFGCRVHVRDVGHAAALLGLNALKPLVLTAGIFRKLETMRVPSAFLEELLDHSVAVGTLAQRIAKDLPLDAYDADHALLGGILHDVGKLVLADHFGREYACVRTAAARATCPLEWAENDQFAISHAEVGGYLLALWGLPQPVLEAVAFHHGRQDLERWRSSPTCCVQIANALIHACSLSQRDEADGADEADENPSPAVPRGQRPSPWQSLIADDRWELWKSWGRDLYAQAPLA